MSNRHRVSGEYDGRRISGVGVKMSDTDVFDDDSEEVVEETKTEETTETESEKVEEKVEPTSTEATVPIAALLDERQKRQGLQKQVDAYKAQETPVEKPDPVTDPDGFAAHLESTNADAIQKLRIELSTDAMQDSREDYSEMEKIFTGMVSEEVDGKRVLTNESLYRQWQTASSPAKFAYEHGKKQKLFDERTAPDYEERQKAKWIAELQGKSTELPDLTSATATESNVEGVLQDRRDEMDMWD